MNGNGVKLRFSAAARAERERMKLSRREISRRVGVKETVVAMWEDGETLPSNMEWKRLTGSLTRLVGQLGPYPEMVRIQAPYLVARPKAQGDSGNIVMPDAPPSAPPPPKREEAGSLAGTSVLRLTQSRRDDGDPSWETITPEIAEELLKHNTHNRPLSEGHVLTMAHIIERGEYVACSGEPFKIARSGVILNGQHRLMAVTLAKKPIRELVIRNMREDAVSDLGKSRSWVDCSILRGADRPHLRAREAIARLTWRMELGEHGRKMTFGEIDEIMSRDEEHITWAVELLDNRKVRRPFNTTSVMSACAYAHPVAPEFIEDQARRLATGLELKAGSPAAIITSSFHYMQERKMSLSNTEQLVRRILRSFQAGLEGLRLSRMEDTPQGLAFFRKRRDALGIQSMERQDLYRHFTVEQ